MARRLPRRHRDDRGPDQRLRAHEPHHRHGDCDRHGQWTVVDTTYQQEQIDGTTSERSEHTRWDLTYDGPDLVGAIELDEQGRPLPFTWTWRWDASHRMLEERYRILVIDGQPDTNTADGSLDFTSTYAWSGDRLEAVTQRDDEPYDTTYEKEWS